MTAQNSFATAPEKPRRIAVHRCAVRQRQKENVMTSVISVDRHKKPHPRKPSHTTRDAVQPISPTTLIDYLRSEAAGILAAALGASPLQSFQVGSLGNFPYFWQNPSNLEFNHLTYGWIDSNLAAKTTPVAQDELFTNLYIPALAA